MPTAPKTIKRIKLALVMAVFRQRVEREQQRHQHDAADQHVEEDGEGAGLDRAEETGSNWKRELHRLAQSARVVPIAATQPEQAARQPERQRRIDQHDGHAGEREHDLGKNAERLGSRRSSRGFTAAPPLATRFAATVRRQLSCSIQLAADARRSESNWSRAKAPGPSPASAPQAAHSTANSPKCRSLPGFDAASLLSGP